MVGILLVDEDAAVLTMLRLALTRAGHKVLRAIPGGRALEMRDQDEQFDLLLTDVIMPGLNGFDLARTMVDRRRDLPVLCLTGFADEAQHMRGKEKRPGTLRSKPILPHDLRRELNEALAAPGALMVSMSCCVRAHRGGDDDEVDIQN